MHPGAAVLLSTLGKTLVMFCRVVGGAGVSHGFPA